MFAPAKWVLLASPVIYTMYGLLSRHLIWQSLPPVCQLVGQPSSTGWPAGSSSFHRFASDLFMRRSFRSSVQATSPNFVFVMGDLFSSGAHLSTDSEYGPSAARTCVSLTVAVACCQVAPLPLAVPPHLPQEIQTAHPAPPSTHHPSLPPVKGV